MTRRQIPPVPQEGGQPQVMAPMRRPGPAHTPPHRNLDQLDAGTGGQDPSFENVVRVLEGE